MLLAVDYKIASSVIANRIKNVLEKIIGESQQGFIRGRKITDNTRFLFDLMVKMDDKNLNGLLLLIDFEKAFDTLHWEFIDCSLQFFNFGLSLRHWIKTFYSNITSCILTIMVIVPIFSLLNEEFDKGTHCHLIYSL